MKNCTSRFIILLLTIPVLLWGQGTYYNGIDTGSASFVTDLHNLIYPHTKISYDQFDETNVANFASRDTTGGQKVVTCVYSGENFVYTVPFTWGTFSREHTWCHSWMPTHPSTSGPEYSDQHHLFPTNQNNANGVRSNHPEGIVVTVTSSYLQSKYGKDSNGDNVFEPRDSHKGDMARALFYMAVCYNGVDGNDWTFNQLNISTLPALSEAPQDVDVLIQWHTQDPPDSWEIARNEYVYSLQGNRNPFVDHPEYVNIIDFNTLAKKTTTTLADEVTNYPGGFDTPVITSSSIIVTWTDPSGVVLPSGYLLVANTTNVFSDPVDGYVYSDDTNLADGSARVNVAYGAGQYSFNSLNSSTQYSFRVYPYNGSGGARNYKTTSFPGTLTIIYTTLSGGSTSEPSVAVNEYFNGGTGVSEWVELLVLQNNLDMRGMKIRDYSSGGSQQNVANPLTFASVDAWQSVPYGTFIVIFKTAATGAPSEETDFSDKSVVISCSNTAYFTSPTTPFDIAGSADAIELFTTGNTHIHSLSHGSYPGLIGSIPQPRANAIGSSATGSVVRFHSTSLSSDFSDTTNAEHSSTITMGTANDAVQQNYITTLLPVELTSFTAVAKGKDVELVWKTATEVNNYGFEVERKQIPLVPSGHSPFVKGETSEASGGFEQVGFVEGHGTTNAPQYYNFVDGTAKGKVAYRLKQIDNDGKFEYSQEAEVTVSPAPQVFALMQNYPNPFNPATKIRFSIPRSSAVRLQVLDMLGREVKTLVNESKPPGEYAVEFDGSSLSSGIYFCTLQAGNFTETKKLMLLK